MTLSSGIERAGIERAGIGREGAEPLHGSSPIGLPHAARLLRPFPSKLPARLGAFALERFPPATYGLLIFAFLACGLVGSARATGDGPSFDMRWAVAALLVTLTFFRLRIADDLKDEAVDRLGRPDRPLPRGLVTAGELRAAAAACVVIELALAATLGQGAFVAYLVALPFSLLAGVDFFLGPALHRNLVVYALAHAPVVPLLLGVLWWTEGHAHAGPALLGMAVLALGVTLSVEVVRKTVAPAAERPHVETYSGALGVQRAVFLGAAALGTGALGGVIYALSVAAPSSVAVGLVVAGAGIVAAGATLRHPSLVARWRAIASMFALGLLLLPIAVVILEGGLTR